MIRVRSEIVSPVINDFIRACVRTYTDDGSKTIFFPITGECLLSLSLSLSLLISNRSHGLENLDLDLSPLDPILISCVSPPSPFRLSLRYLYIGCPNFPPCRDRAFNPFLALRSQQSSRERSRLSQMKSRVKHVIKNAEWYSFLRQALRRQVRHIPRSFVVRKQSA